MASFADLKDAIIWATRLMLLCGSREPRSANAATKLPTPAELIKMSQNPFVQLFHVGALVHLGARAYQKIGKDDVAVELARAGVAESMNSLEVLEYGLETMNYLKGQNIIHIQRNMCL